MNFKKTILLLLLSAPLTSWSQSDLTPNSRPAVGSEMQKPHLGLRLGVAEPEGELNSGIQIAVEYGLQFYVPYSLAVEVGHEAYDEAGFDFNRTSVLMKGNYNFGGDIPVIKYSYVGLGLGLAWEDDSINDGLAALIVPQVGFDVPINGFLNDRISLGANVGYTFTTRGTPDVFAASGVVKYWF